MYEAASNMWCGMWEIMPENLRVAMDRAKVNNTQLADMVGLKQPSITRLLSGETKTTRSLFALAKALKTSPEFLKGEIDHPFEGIADEWFANRDAMLRGDAVPYGTYIDERLSSSLSFGFCSFADLAHFALSAG